MAPKRYQDMTDKNWSLTHAGISPKQDSRRLLRQSTAELSLCNLQNAFQMNNMWRVFNIGYAS